MTNVTFPQLIQRGCGIDVHLKVVVATIDGVGICKETRTGFVEEHHVYMLQMIRKSIAQTQGLVDELSKRIKEILIKYDNVLELLKEIPGFNTKVVEDLVSEISLDMSAFPSEKHLASRAGICPGNNESANLSCV